MPVPYHSIVPQMRTLRAFESAGRLGSFSAAADELDTTQSAVSRTIAELERRMAVRLFERRHRGVSLTEAGELYHKAVSDSLARIVAAAAYASQTADSRKVVIACGPATSELFLMPRFKTLHQRIGENATVRVLSSTYDMLDRLNEADADIVLSYGAKDTTGDRTVVFRDEVTAVCSPDFAATHAGVLRRPIARWGSLPFLEMVGPTKEWTTWGDWFEAVGRPDIPPQFVNYHDYVYLIDAAASGRGLALGWRNFLDRFFDLGSLVPVFDGYVKFDHAHYARLTERGRRHPLARRCLDVLGSLAN